MTGPIARTMPRLGAALALVVPLIVSAAAATTEDPKPSPRAQRPDLTDPIVCLSIRGFRDYEPRDEPALRADEKLQIYYEPFNYLIVRDGPDAPYRAHLSEDVRLRRKGGDRVLSRIDSIVDYQPEESEPPTPLFMATTISVKELPPGDYELDLILRDELAEGAPTVERTISFRIRRADEGDGG